MKKLILLIFFFGSLDSFSQVELKTLPGINVVHGDTFLTTGYVVIKPTRAVPDTLRATLIVYHDGDNSIVHTMPGFVVQQYLKDDVYLDDKKRVIKAPMEVLMFKLK